MNMLQGKTYTPADLLAMPDANNVELVDGQLVEKPRSVLSSIVEGNLFAKLKNFCDGQRLGVVLPSTNGIQCFPGDPGKVRKPDACFVKRERFTREHLAEGFLSIAPDLAAEVISSHDEFTEVTEKVEEYLAAGIPLVWVIDPENELAYVHRDDGSVTKLRKNDELTGEKVLPGFTCKLSELLPAI